MVNLIELRLNAANHFKMCYVALIMLRGLLLVFVNQIQSEYYCGNKYVSIEGIILEHFSALPQTEINSSTKLCLRNAVFHYFLSDDSKQDAATTTAHSNRLI